MSLPGGSQRGAEKVITDGERNSVRGDLYRLEKAFSGIGLFYEGRGGAVPLGKETPKRMRLR